MLKEMIAEQSSQTEHVSDDDLAELVDFIVQSLRNHAIKKADKNNFQFSPQMMGLAMAKEMFS